MLPNKSLTQKDLAAWGMPIGRVKGYTGYTENQGFAYTPYAKPQERRKRS